MTSGIPAAEANKPRLAVQAFSLLVARTIAFIVALAMPLVVVRMLDKNEFGLYRLTLTVITTAATILPFSVGVSAFYFLPRLAGFQRHALIFNIVAYHLVVGMAVAVAFAVWPGLIVSWTGTEAVRGYAPLVGVNVGIVMFSAFFDNAATANQDVWHSTVFIVGGQLSRSIFVIGTAVLFGTVEALLYAWIIMGALQCIALLWYLHYRFPHFWRYRSRQLTLEQLQYVIPFGLTALTITAQLDVHNYFVSHNFTPAQFGIYALGTSQIPLIGIVRDSINSVMQARMSKLQQEDRKQEMLALMTKAWRTLAMAFIPVFAGLMVLAVDFIGTLYGPKYLDSVPILRLNLCLLLTPIFVTDSVIRAFAEHRYWFLRLRIALLVVQLALSFVLTPYVGMTGPLLSMIFTMVIERIISVRLVFRTLRVPSGHDKRFADFGRLVLFSGLAAVVTMAALGISPLQAHFARLALGILVFAAVYLSAILISGFLSGEERDLLKKAANRLLRPLAPRLAQKIAQL